MLQALLNESIIKIKINFFKKNQFYDWTVETPLK